MSALRILVINWQDWSHPNAGGAEFHLREVFGRLAGRGHRVDLLCTSHGDAPPQERMEGINVIRRGSHYPLFNYTVPGTYRRVLRRNDYDVIVDDLNKVPFYAPLFTDLPVVALVHHLFGATVFQETNALFGGYVYLSELPVGWVYRRSRFIAVSQSTADDLIERGVDRDRITVVPNGLPEQPAPDLTYEEILSEPKTGMPSFAYLGRLKRYKSIDLILDAFSMLPERHRDARLVIAGEGDHRPALEARAAELNLGNRVHFPGWVSDAQKWRLLRRSWAVLYTSPKEGWGISSLEAQRVGTIAIVSDAPGLRDTVQDERTGLIVPHADVRALAAALERSIERPDERGEMEEAAVERARGFSWDSATDQTLEVLQEAVRAGRS